MAQNQRPKQLLDLPARRQDYSPKNYKKADVTQEARRLIAFSFIVIALLLVSWLCNKA